LSSSDWLSSIVLSSEFVTLFRIEKLTGALSAAAESIPSRLKWVVSALGIRRKGTLFVIQISQRLAYNHTQSGSCHQVFQFSSQAAIRNVFPWQQLLY